MTTLAPSESAPVVDRSHAVKQMPREATRAGQAGEGTEIAGALRIMGSDDVKPANPKPRIADEKGCSPPYTMDARGKELWKLKCP